MGLIKMSSEKTAWVVPGVVVVWLFLAVTCEARIIVVNDDGPADFNNIQAAIIDANDGDFVMVLPGTYKGNGNRDIDFLDKAITVQSIEPNDPDIVDATIIDLQSSYNRGFKFVSGEGPNSVLAGLTVTNGYGLSDAIPYGRTYGGAILCVDSSPVILQCVFKNNQAQSGGAIYCTQGGELGSPSNPILLNCTFNNNITYEYGGALSNYESSPIISGCIFKANSAWYSGGAIHNRIDSSPEIRNCTIVNNVAHVGGDGFGGGISYGSPAVTNCIFWANSDGGGTDESAQIHGGTPVVSYSCMKGLDTLAGSGNIGSDPCFADPCSGDYHLLQTSPCVDAGDPNYVPEANETDIDGEPRVMGGRVDMGVDEVEVLSIDLNMDELWMYQNLPGQTGSNITADASITYDPNVNSSYSYGWEIVLPGDVTLAPVTVDGGGAADGYWTFAAAGCDEPEGLSDSGQTFTVRVTVTGDDYGNTVQAEAEFGIALLGDINNDGVVNVADRSIANAFWRTGSAGAYTLQDCDVNCDGVVNVADRSITNAVWRGILGQNSVSSPCPLR
jgi:predicted outer membrane repeat protein